MKYRISLSIALSASIAIVLAACGSGAEKDAASASPSTAPAPITVTVGDPGLNSTQLPQIVAQDEGIFAKHGIKESLVSFSGGPATIAAIVSGSVDIATSAPTSIAEADQQGNSLAFFCGINPDPTTQFIAPAHSTLKPGSWNSVLRQLTGKTIGVQVTGGTAQLQWQAALTEAGVNPDAVTFVPVGIGGPAEAAFLKGEVDVYGAYFPLSQQLVSSGQAKLLTTVGANLPSPAVFTSYQYGLYSSKKWIQSHEALARQYCAAIGDAVSYIQDPKHLSTVEKIIRTTFDVSSPVADSGAKALIPGYSTALTEATINAALKAASPPVKLTYNDIVLKPSA